MSTFQGSMLCDECRNSISNMVNLSLVPKVTVSYSSTEPAEEELPLSREEFCLGAVLCPAPALLTLAFFPYGPQPWRLAQLGRSPWGQLSRWFSSQQGEAIDWETLKCLLRGWIWEQVVLPSSDGLPPWPNSGQGLLSPLGLNLQRASLSGLHSPI